MVSRTIGVPYPDYIDPDRIDSDPLREAPRGDIVEFMHEDPRPYFSAGEIATEFGVTAKTIRENRMPKLLTQNIVRKDDELDEHVYWLDHPDSKYAVPGDLDALDDDDGISHDKWIMIYPSNIESSVPVGWGTAVGIPGLLIAVGVILFGAAVPLVVGGVISMESLGAVLGGAALLHFGALFVLVMVGALAIGERVYRRLLTNPNLDEENQW